MQLLQEIFVYLNIVSKINKRYSLHGSLFVKHRLRRRTKKTNVTIGWPTCSAILLSRIDLWKSIIINLIAKQNSGGV